MKAIVTGGAGFIGSTLVKKLINELNYEVLVIDCLNYASQVEALDELKNQDFFSFSESDISDESQINSLVLNYKPDYIFNLAAETHVDRSIDSPESFIKTNILGTFALLNVSLNYWRSLDADKKKYFKFLHVSTDEVFGDLEIDSKPFEESDRYDPSSPYSASKASSDHLVRAWHRTYNLPVLLSNCSNNYGPFQFYEKLIPLMVIKALRGERLPVYGTGLQIRDWLYVEDHADALIKIIQTGKIGESYNVGASCERSNLYIVELICEILDETIDLKPDGLITFSDLITFVEDRPGHDKRYAINSNKIIKNLGWKPKVDFETGLRKTIKWYVERNEDVTYEANRLGKNK